jgi:hypothetical protein
VGARELTDTGARGTNARARLVWLGCLVRWLVQVMYSVCVYIYIYIYIYIYARVLQNEVIKDVNK